MPLPRCRIPILTVAGLIQIAALQRNAMLLPPPAMKASPWLNLDPWRHCGTAIGEHGQLTGRPVDACQLQLGIAVTKGFSSGCITLLDVDPFVAISRLPLVEWLRRGEEGRHQFRG